MDLEIVTGYETNNNISFAADYKINIKYYNDNPNGRGCILYEEENGTYNYDQNTKILTFKSNAGNSTESNNVESITNNEIILLIDEYDEMVF